MSCNFLQRIDVLKSFSIAIRREEVLDNFESKQNLASPRDLVKKVDIVWYVIPKRNARTETTVSGTKTLRYLQEKIQHHVRHRYETHRNLKDT